MRTRLTDAVATWDTDRLVLLLGYLESLDDDFDE